MAAWTRILERAFVTGSISSFVSTAALALFARAESKGAFQPVNATTHCLNGSRAADLEDTDLTHTATGYATHHAGTIFWAFLFEAWLDRRPPRGAAGLVGDALLMSVAAAAVDYGPTPKRFTRAGSSSSPSEGWPRHTARWRSGWLSDQRGPVSVGIAGFSETIEPDAAWLMTLIGPFRLAVTSPWDATPTRIRARSFARSRNWFPEGLGVGSQSLKEASINGVEVGPFWKSGALGAPVSTFQVASAAFARAIERANSR